MFLVDILTLAHCDSKLLWDGPFESCQSEVTAVPRMENSIYNTIVSQKLIPD